MWVRSRYWGSVCSQWWRLTYIPLPLSSMVSLMIPLSMTFGITRPGGRSVSRWITIMTSVLPFPLSFMGPIPIRVMRCGRWRVLAGIRTMVIGTGWWLVMMTTTRAWPVMRVLGVSLWRHGVMCPLRQTLRSRMCHWPSTRWWGILRRVGVSRWMGRWRTIWVKWHGWRRHRMTMGRWVLARCWRRDWCGSWS